jgi:hypothetical protein
MNTQEALNHFNGSARLLGEALGITREAIYQWGERVPPLRAYQIREILALREKLGAGDTPIVPQQEAA